MQIVDVIPWAGGTIRNYLTCLHVEYILNRANMDRKRGFRRNFPEGRRTRKSTCIGIPIDKAMIVKAGEMETFSFALSEDLFNTIKPDNKKRKLSFALTYLDSNGKSKSGKFNMGFISMSGSKKTVYSDRGYLDMRKLPYDKGGLFVIMDDKYLKSGNPQMGFDQMEYRLERITETK